MLGNRAAVVDLRAGIILSSPIGAAALTRGMFMSCSFLKSWEVEQGSRVVLQWAGKLQGGWHELVSVDFVGFGFRRRCQKAPPPVHDT